MSRRSGPSKWPMPCWSVSRRRITPAETARFLAILATFPITVDDETVAHAWLDTMHLACAEPVVLRRGLPGAGAGGLPLAALDGKLKTAAQAVGVPLFEVA